jgi:hypothetical protein
MPRIEVKMGMKISPKLIMLPFHGVEAVINETIGIKKLIRIINPER